jgi:amino acid permease
MANTFKVFFFFYFWFLCWQSIVGSGILGLPYAFLMGGWLFSLLSFPIIAVSSGYWYLTI